MTTATKSEQPATREHLRQLVTALEAVKGKADNLTARVEQLESKGAILSETGPAVTDTAGKIAWLDADHSRLSRAVARLAVFMRILGAILALYAVILTACSGWMWYVIMGELAAGAILPGAAPLLIQVIVASAVTVFALITIILTYQAYRFVKEATYQESRRRRG